MAQKAEYQQASKKRKIEQPLLSIQFESRNIPHDIAISILSRLPIKSLLRFKAVCKSWYALIKSPYFARFHLLHQSNDTRNLAYFIHDDIHICSVNFPALNEVGGYEVGEIDYPFKSTTSSATILGSVNGIFLLGIHNDSQVMTTEQKDRLLFAFSAVCIWNPSTREYRKLPDAFIKIPKYRINCKSIVYGFGYDTVSDDYKVIRIFYYCDRILVPASLIDYYESDVHIYSLKTNSFKRIQDIPYFIIYPDIDKGIFLNGAIHWLGRKDWLGIDDWLSCRDIDTFPIVCYNISSEEYSVMEMPKFCYSNVCSEVMFGVLEGYLCVCRKFESNVVDVHIMKEYGVKESWTKIYSIPIEGPVTDFRLGLTNNGEILFTTSSEFCDSSVSLYQPKEKEKGLIELEICGIPPWFPRLYKIEPYGSPRLYVVQPYIRSLVPIN